MSFRPEEVKEELKAGGAEVEDVWILPTGTAKHVSPLDNCIWHDVKEAIRKSAPNDEDETAERMHDSFMALDAEKLKHHYRNCVLTTGSDFYKGLITDCA